MAEAARDHRAVRDVADGPGARVAHGDVALALRVAPVRARRERLGEQENVELGLATGRIALPEARRGRAQVLVTLPAASAGPSEDVEPFRRRAHVELVGRRSADDGP